MVLCNKELFCRYFGEDGYDTIIELLELTNLEMHLLEYDIIKLRVMFIDRCDDFFLGSFGIDYNRLTYSITYKRLVTVILNYYINRPSYNYQEFL